MIKEFIKYLNENNYSNLIIYDNNGNLIFTNEIAKLFDTFVKDKNNRLVFTLDDIKVVTDSSHPSNPNYHGDVFTKLDDLVALHITSIPPFGDRIITPEHGGVTRSIYFNDPSTGKKHEVKYPIGNDTIHFTLNCHVENHAAGNDWDSYEYGVIVDFNNLDRSKILDVKGEDTYLDGDAKLGSNYILLCPLGKREEMLKLNPNAVVIEYDGISLQDAMSRLIVYKGKKLEPYGTYSWGRNFEFQGDSEDTRKLEILTVDNNFPCLKGKFGYALHSETKYMARRMWKREYEALINLLEYNAINNIAMPDEVILNILYYGGAYATPGVLEVSVDNYKEFVIPILEKHGYSVDDTFFADIDPNEVDYKMLGDSIQFASFENILRDRVIQIIKKSLGEKNDLENGVTKK